MSDDVTLHDLAMAVVREALTNGTTSEKLAAVRYVLPQVGPTTAQDYSPVSSAAVVFHVGEDDSASDSGPVDRLSGIHDQA